VRTGYPTQPKLEVKSQGKSFSKAAFFIITLDVKIAFNGGDGILLHPERIAVFYEW